MYQSHYLPTSPPLGKRNESELLAGHQVVCLCPLRTNSTMNIPCTCTNRLYNEQLTLLPWTNLYSLTYPLYYKTYINVLIPWSQGNNSPSPSSFFFLYERTRPLTRLSRPYNFSGYWFGWNYDPLLYYRYILLGKIQFMLINEIKNTWNIKINIKNKAYRCKIDVKFIVVAIFCVWCTNDE
jgi:hypothetical protein